MSIARSTAAAVAVARRVGRVRHSAVVPAATTHRHTRPLSTSTSTPAPPYVPTRSQRQAGAASSSPAYFASADHEQDAKAVKDIFDAPAGAAAAAATASSSGAPTSGLFGSPSLPDPSAFVPLAQRTLVRAQLLVSRIVSAPANGDGEMRKVVKNLDRLSDLLCSVIDLAELVRNAHPSDAWRDAANEAYEGLCGFMNVLNTHTGLYDVLRRVLDDDSLRGALSPEALAVATTFLRDFEKSGIHLPSAQREKFVTLSDDILILGRAFMQGESTPDAQPSAADTQPVRFEREWFTGVHSNLLAALEKSPALLASSQSSQICLIPALATWEFPTILRYATNADARRVAYNALNTSGRSNVDVLERLLRRRAELAKLTGYTSYGQMTLGDKMAQNPDNVDKFLRALESHHRPMALSKIDELRALKGADLDAWDRDFYAEQYMRNRARWQSGSHSPISSFFSVGNVFSGLSQMLSSLYGIRLRPSAMQPGESWNDDVVKLEVVEEDTAAASGETIIGTIYADLFSRPGKPPSAAHYTVRCSRRLDDDDAEGDFAFGRLDDGGQVDAAHGRPGGLASLLEVVDARSNPGRQGKYQTPIVVLVCDFVRPSNASGPSLLGWNEVETLFHEMGHAIHSMIGRTEYHNVSGTRCATDLVELPSILMEHFISSPAVIGLVAKHHSTGLALPYAELEKHLAYTKALDSLDTHHQILLALLDQAYHSERRDDRQFDSTREMNSLHSELGLLPYDARAAANHTWQGSFTHLFGYGATYYSYLFDRVLASRVWKQVFADAPLDRNAGERYKQELLKWGGGRDGWEMLTRLLRESDTLDMGKVGQWGIQGR